LSLDSPPPADDEYPERFDALWAAYPRREGKKAAYRKVRVLLRKNVRYEEMMNAVVNYAATCIDKEAKHIKLASTFFGPDDHWREWVWSSDAGMAQEDPVAEAARRNAESAPPPKNFAASVRETLLKGNPDGTE
jgi:hypothetical protein